MVVRHLSPYLPIVLKPGISLPLLRQSNLSGWIAATGSTSNTPQKQLRKTAASGRFYAIRHGLAAGNG